jgi:hypothetical protein
MQNARHLPDRTAIFHAINRVFIRGVEMACNTPIPALKRTYGGRSARGPTAEGYMACNTLPHKIAALREAHQFVVGQLMRSVTNEPYVVTVSIK